MIAISGLEAKQYYVTKEGAEELRRLLENLRHSRTHLLEEIRGFIAQNGNVLDDPIQAHRFSQAEELEGQIVRLQHILATVKIIDKPTAHKRVQLGSRVVVEIGGTKHTYTVVGSLEADPSQGKISNESPLGMLLMGRKAAERFSIIIRKQPVGATIISIA